MLYDVSKASLFGLNNDDVMMGVYRSLDRNA